MAVHRRGPRWKTGYPCLERVLASGRPDPGEGRGTARGMKRAVLCISSSCGMSCWRWAASSSSRLRGFNLNDRVAAASDTCCAETCACTCDVQLPVPFIVYAEPGCQGCAILLGEPYSYAVPFSASGLIY